MRMNELVPREMHGWTMQGSDETYNRKTIFDYIDGAGEVYLAYGFKELLVRNFANQDEPNEPEVTVELFDMGSSEDAFGIFSHSREGEEGEIGQGSQYQAGLLFFWKARFFVCVLAKQETPAAKQAVMALGEAIANAIPERGSKPRLLNLLPEEGLIQQSIRYFHTHPMLNYHYFVATENVLKLDANTSGVLAQYQHPEGKSYLLLIDYPTPSQAKAAYENFLASYMPEANNAGAVQTENGKWTAARMQVSRPKLIPVVFDAATLARTEALLGAVHKKLEVTHP